MRVGIIIVNNHIKNYEIEELSNLIKSKYKIKYIFSEIKEKPKKNRFLKFLNSIVVNNFFNLIYIERKFAYLIRNRNSFLSKLKDLEKNINILEQFPELNKTNIHNFKSIKMTRITYGFDEDMNIKIRNNCDVLILFGYNKIIDNIFLNQIKYGILSFHTSNINKYRGRPSAFYEFINNEDKGGVTLQNLNRRIDSGNIIEQKETEIVNCKSYEETLCKMMSLKKDLVVSGLFKLENNIIFERTNKDIKLSINKESRKIRNVFACLKKTILRRYFN